MTPGGETPERPKSAQQSKIRRNTPEVAKRENPPTTQLPLNIPPTNVEKDVPRRGGWQAPGDASRRMPEPTRTAPEAVPLNTREPSRRGTDHTPSSTAPMAGANSPASARRTSGRRAAGRGGFRVPSGRRGTGVISRGERALFWVLLATVLAMTIFLVRYRERVNAHFEARAMAVPLASAGSAVTTRQLTLYLANDITGSLMERSLVYPLPDDPNTRAQVVLEKLLAEYTAPGSPHPLQPLQPGVEGVDEVFLMPTPGHPHESNELAVVDLTPNFVHTHPSGMEPEMLTLLSMIATLHANMPRVTQVRFLVDGQTQPTLAGHADLAQTYLAGAAQMTPQEAFATAGVR